MQIRTRRAFRRTENIPSPAGYPRTPGYFGCAYGTIIGDIVADENCALVCLPEISCYIAENLTKAGRVGIAAEAIALRELPARAEELTIKTDTVASLRLDAVLSAAFGLSRAKASELIASGRVSLNHQICLRADKDMSENALISVRGLGRAKLLEVGGVSKKRQKFRQNRAVQAMNE